MLSHGYIKPTKMVRQVELLRFDFTTTMLAERGRHGDRGFLPSGSARIRRMQLNEFPLDGLTPSVLWSGLDADTKAKSARTAMLFSRTNTLLSIPMLFAMVSAQNIF